MAAFPRQMHCWPICPAARVLLGFSTWLCAGCGATGLAWVDEAHLESVQLQSVGAVRAPNSGAVSSASIPATAEQDSSEPRPRLNHTVTLGEIDAVQAPPNAQLAAASGPAVIVNNYNQVNLVTPAFGYANYGYWHTSPGFSPGRVTVNPPSSRASGPQPGQNWPAVADHGPSFPYASAPASPWTRTQ